MKIVISPAKSLDFEKNLPTEKFSKPSYLKQSKEIVKVLKTLKPKEFVGTDGYFTSFGRIKLATQ